MLTKATIRKPPVKLQTFPRKSADFYTQKCGRVLID